ncbi:MAG: lipid-binding SYLF domain-containing protein [Porticoccus sp.]
MNFLFKQNETTFKIPSIGQGLCLEGGKPIKSMYKGNKMKQLRLSPSKYLSFIFVLAFFCLSLNVSAETPSGVPNKALDGDIHAAIQHLMNTSPEARELASSAKGALIFPNVVKAGFLVGGLYGNGALVRSKAGGGYYIANYYTLAAASYGMQAGVQTFGYMLALMTDAAVEHVETSSGWELSMGPSIVVVDKGTAGTLASTRLTKNTDVYAFTFGQKGLMAGMGMQGSKITRLNK